MLFLPILVLNTFFGKSLQSIVLQENDEISTKLVNVTSNYINKLYQQTTTEIIIKNKKHLVDDFLFRSHKMMASKVVLYNKENDVYCLPIPVNISVFISCMFLS